MDDVMHLCSEGLWPLKPSCSHTIAFGVYAGFSLLNVIITCLPRSSTVPYRRVGSLPISFYLAVVCKSLLIALSLGYIAFVFYIHNYSHLLAAYVASKLVFWLVCLITFIKWKDLSYLPVSLAVSFSAALFVQIAPLTNWSVYFPPSTKSELVFYVGEASLTLLVFLTTMCASTVKTETPSTWSGMSRKLSMIAPYVWPKKSFALQLRVVLCLFLLVFGRIINVALPLYNKWIIDALAQPHVFPWALICISTFLKFLQGSGAMGGFLNTLRSYFWIPIQQYTTREMQVELFEHLHALSLRWHLSRKTGLVLRVMDRGTQSINSILNYVLFNIVPTIMDILIAVTFFFSTFNWYFGALVLVTMVIYLGLTIWITEWRTKFRREMNDKDNNVSAIGTDSLLNYETVKYYGNEKFEVDRFQAAILDYQHSEWRANASLALLNFLQNNIIGAGLVAGSLLVAYLISIDNTLTVGDYVLFTTYILQLYVPLNFFGTVYRTIQKAFVDMENMFDLMNEEVEVFDAPNALDYEPTEALISVKDLSFEYLSGNPVLQNVSFDVKNGQTVALVGPSGSGKSTIVRLLFRLFEAKQGSIEFDNVDVKDIKMRELRKNIGIVPQDTVLFNDTIRYNIRFGRPSATDEEVEEAARAAMIHDKIMALPDRYDTLVGERGLKLSGGEKQRVAIARTILKRPQFIFLDEATSALDTNTERAIQRCLEELCVSRTTVVVAHRLSTVVNADLIIVLDKGRIIERGTHHELLALGGVYTKMWQSQSTDMSDANLSTRSDEGITVAIPIEKKD